MMTTKPELRDFTDSYVECALWTSHDESLGEDVSDMRDVPLAPETIATMESDCLDFYRANRKDVAGRESEAGHDFWLTRCGHGAGFWDGDWPEPAATRLDVAARSAGERTLYVGDDGLVYIE